MDYHVSFVGGDVVIVGGKVDFDSDYDTIYIYICCDFSHSARYVEVESDIY